MENKTIGDLATMNFTFEDIEKAYVAGMDRGVELCINQLNKDKQTNNTQTFIQYIQKYLK